jgi:hypothetical protein
MSQRNNILQELNELGSSLGTLEPGIPYAVPTGYFDNLLPELMKRIHAMEGSAKTEIETLSPLLAGIKREMPFEVPGKYFGYVPLPQADMARVIYMNPRKWLRYVAAVFVAGVFIASGLVIYRYNNVEKMPMDKFVYKLNKEIGKMSDLELAEFMEYTDAGLVGDEKVNSTPNDDVKELLEDIPVSELKEFIEETSVIDTDEVLMN